MKRTLVVDELRAPTRKIQASVWMVGRFREGVQSGKWAKRGVNAHRENVMTCEQSGEWHSKDGNDAT